MDAGLTRLSEKDVERHIPLAQSLVTRFVVMADANRSGPTIAGTGRRFVSPVSSAGLRRTRQVELGKTIAALRPDDAMLSIGQHTLLYRIRRGLAVALAVSDSFARACDLEQLHSRNTRSPLEGEDATRYRRLMAASAFVCAFAFASYLHQLIEGETELAGEFGEPDFAFDTAQDALKALLAGLDGALEGAMDDHELNARARAFAQFALEGLLARKARFDGLGPFAGAHIHLESDDFTLDGFDVAPGRRAKPLEMSFKKPQEIVGNHVAKYQAVKLAKMLMAYDFDRQLNPCVELGGFIFTFVGDGAPGTGKTSLIQMIAGLVRDYCQVARVPFHYENFGVDQISSYQGKSGQNCRQFINNILDPRAIGFGTIDDVDQVAARRSDDRASAGQHEVTGVLMEAFSGASTVIRGNCSFGMFSNHPENVDDALRQRASARWLVDGPQTREDYVDIFVLLAGSNHDILLGEHDLYASQEIQRAVQAAYQTHARPQEEGLRRVHDAFLNRHGEPRTMADIGTYLHMIKQAEPRFTGRAIKNITDAIKMRAMDIELPDEWFERPDIFMHESYERKRDMIAALRTPFSMEVVMQEVNRYADSEFRYSDRADDAAVARLVREARLRERAVRQIEHEKAQGR